MPSGPFDFVVSSDMSISSTSSSVQKYSSGQEVQPTSERLILSKSDSLSGGTAELKHWAKKLFRRVAFSLLIVVNCISIAVF